MPGIKDQFVTYEIALGLKELGFDEECFAIFFRTILNNGRTVNYISDDWESPFYKNRTNSESNSVDIVSAPLWQQVIDWFREEKLIDILILPQDQSACDPLPLYFFAIISYKNEICVELYNSSDKLHYSEFNEAREHAIKRAIELCQKEK